MNSILHETLFKYITFSSGKLGDITHDIISHLYGRVSGSEIVDEHESLLALVKHCFSLMNNEEKVAALNHTCCVYNNIREETAPYLLKKKLVQQLYCDLITQENYEISISHVLKRNYFSKDSLLNSAIESRCELILDTTLACNIMTNSGELSVNDEDKSNNYSSTLFSSAIELCVSIANYDAIPKLLSLPWDKTVAVNLKAANELYTNLEVALVAHSCGLSYDDYAEYTSKIVINTVASAFESFKRIKVDTDTRIEDAKKTIKDLKKNIATLADIEGDINVAFTREAVLKELVEIAKDKNRLYSYHASMFTTSRHSQVIGQVIDLLEPIIKTKNIFTDQDSSLPAHMYKLSKTNYGEVFIEYIKSEHTPEQLISDATSSAQAEFIVNLYDMDPFTALSMVEKQGIKSKLMTTLMS